VSRSLGKCLLMLHCFLVLCSWVSAQDRVQYRDEKDKLATTSGTIQVENVLEVVLRAGTTKTERRIPTPAVVDITYDGQPIEAASAAAAERNRNYEKALALYREAWTKAPKDRRYLVCHLQFKIAKLQAQLAEAKGGPLRRQAIDDLRRFLKEYPESRQMLEALDLLSRLLLSENESPREVIAAYAKLKERYGSTHKEIATRADVLEVRLLLAEAHQAHANDPATASEKFAATAQKLEALVKSAGAAAPLELRAARAVARAGAGQGEASLKELDELLAATQDPHGRAILHEARADCYRLLQRPRDAMWDYLWVDVVYNEDAELQARALYYLAQLFDQLGEPARAKECRERLQNDPRLAQSRYAKQVAASP